MADETFECGVCAEDLPLHLRVLIGEGDDAMCRACITDQFAQDLVRSDEEAETEIGVRWGSRLLHARDYPQVFTLEFINDYEHHLLQFTTPRDQRVYCPHVRPRYEGGDIVICGTFVAAATASAESAICTSCLSLICKCCRRERTSAEHLCPGPAEVPIEEGMDVSLLRRGNDFQSCPGCKQIYQLREACNYVRCAMASCGVGFCYICGKPAEHESDHWTVTACTKWGQPKSVGYAMVDLDVLKLHLDRYLSQMDSEVHIPRWLQHLTEKIWYVVVAWKNGRGRRRFDSASIWGLGMHSWNYAVARSELSTVDGLEEYFLGHPLRLEELLDVIEADGEVKIVDEQPPQQMSPWALLTIHLPPNPKEVDFPIMALFAILEEHLHVALPDWTRDIARDLNLVLRIEHPMFFLNTTAELMRWNLPNTRIPDTFLKAKAASYCRLEALLLKNGGSAVTAIWKHHAAFEASRASKHFFLEAPEYHYIALEATKVREKMRRDQARNCQRLNKKILEAETRDEHEILAASVELPGDMEMLSRSTLMLFQFLRDGQASKPFERPSLVGFWMPDVQETLEEDDALRGQEADALLLMAAWWQYKPRKELLRRFLEEIHERPWAHMLGKVRGPMVPTIVRLDAQNRPGYHKISSSENVPALYMEGFARDDSLFFVAVKPVNDMENEADPSSVKDFRIIKADDM